MTGTGNDRPTDRPTDGRLPLVLTCYIEAHWARRLYLNATHLNGCGTGKLTCFCARRPTYNAGLSLPIDGLCYRATARYQRGFVLTVACMKPAGVLYRLSKMRVGPRFYSCAVSCGSGESPPNYNYHF